MESSIKENNLFESAFTRKKCSTFLDGNLPKKMLLQVSQFGFLI